MSKVLNIPNGNYNIYVQDGGTILLDTGIDQGFVRITGNLIVDGTTTTINTSEMTIEDNTIVLNSGEQGAGITLGTSGLEIERGSLVNARWVFDDSITYEDPITETTVTGAWHSKDGNDKTLAIKTTAIVAHDGGTDSDINFDFDGGDGVLAVISANYSSFVTDDNDIPNKKFVDDAIAASLTSVFQVRIEDGTVTKSYIEVQDFETTGDPSSIEIALDGVVVSTLTPDRFEVAGFRFDGTKIQVIDSNQDLVLSSPGTGVIRIDDTIVINSVPGIDDLTTTPPTPVDGVAIYTSTEGTGGTGIYFVTANDTGGELISKNKALVLSMIF